MQDNCIAVKVTTNFELVDKIQGAADMENLFPGG